ncbi:hypothetical protein CPJCM30710_33540 [Clostridium polyendosporum]|uniref:Uncharacterized protein n=1 Tax=Clostridium polyendosporum TaxID=69208 RepID=A0A919S3U1_9CLOT|nr:hypothetical protein [Clostridium polyendosporum]GIM30688.1 hypothetical protein CPJCM30710_33540 [Clostridium polyendosporum]
MAKYKVGDELIVVQDPNEENQKLKELTKLTIDGEYAQISWGLKIISIEYDKPNVTLTYRNVKGEINKVFAVCKDVENFDNEMVLEKALLKAFQNEIINITVFKNVGYKL